MNVPYDKYNSRYTPRLHNGMLKQALEYVRILEKKNLVKQSEFGKQPTKIIWQCWWQGKENAPDIVKICLNSVEKNKDDYDRIIITENNFKNYADIPQFLIDKYQEKKISNALFSDILRVYLLKKNGGIWIDATCYMTAPIPDNIKNADFFFFDNRQNPVKIANWFIVSRKNHALVNMIADLLTIYWKCNDKEFDYLIFYYLFVSAIDNVPLYKNLFDEVPRDDYLKTVKLQKYILDKNDNLDKMNLMLDSSFIHKLTYKIELNNLLKILK
jgi:hypothetical protein